MKGKAKNIRDAIYDLKAVNPNVKETVVNQTPDNLIQLIFAQNAEVIKLLNQL